MKWTQFLANLRFLLVLSIFQSTVSICDLDVSVSNIRTKESTKKLGIPKLSKFGKLDPTSGVLLELDASNAKSILGLIEPEKSNEAKENFPKAEFALDNDKRNFEELSSQNDDEEFQRTEIPEISKITKIIQIEVEEEKLEESQESQEMEIQEIPEIEEIEEIEEIDEIEELEKIEEIKSFDYVKDTDKIKNIENFEDSLENIDTVVENIKSEEKHEDKGIFRENSYLDSSNSDVNNVDDSLPKLRTDDLSNIQRTQDTPTLVNDEPQSDTNQEFTAAPSFLNSFNTRLHTASILLKQSEAEIIQRIPNEFIPLYKFLTLLCNPVILILLWIFTSVISFPFKRNTSKSTCQRSSSGGAQMSEWKRVSGAFESNQSDLREIKDKLDRLLSLPAEPTKSAAVENDVQQPQMRHQLISYLEGIWNQVVEIKVNSSTILRNQESQPLASTQKPTYDPQDQKDLMKFVAQVVECLTRLNWYFKMFRESITANLEQLGALPFDFPDFPEYDFHEIEESLGMPRNLKQNPHLTDPSYSLALQYHQMASQQAAPEMPQYVLSQQAAPEMPKYVPNQQAASEMPKYVPNQQAAPEMPKYVPNQAAPNQQISKKKY